MVKYVIVDNDNFVIKRSFRYRSAHIVAAAIDG